VGSFKHLPIPLYTHSMFTVHTTLIAKIRRGSHAIQRATTSLFTGLTNK
jgi:hypothetical protein